MYIINIIQYYSSKYNIYCKKIQCFLFIFIDTNVKICYKFDGWYTDDGTFENKFESKFVPMENITLYAKFEATYTDVLTIDKAARVVPQEGYEITYSQGFFDKLKPQSSYTVTVDITGYPNYFDSGYITKKEICTAWCKFLFFVFRFKTALPPRQ